MKAAKRCSYEEPASPKAAENALRGLLQPLAGSRSRARRGAGLASSSRQLQLVFRAFDGLAATSHIGYNSVGRLRDAYCLLMVPGLPS